MTTTTPPPAPLAPPVNAEQTEYLTRKADALVACCQQMRVLMRKHQQLCVQQDQMLDLVLTAVTAMDARAHDPLSAQADALVAQAQGRLQAFIKKMPPAETKKEE